MSRVALWQFDPGREQDMLRFAFREGEVTPERRAAMVKTFDGEIAGEVTPELVFARFNADDRPTAKTAYSLSVGDVIVLPGRTLQVTSVGFEDLPEGLFPAVSA